VLAILAIGLSGLCIRVPRYFSASGYVISEAYAEVRPVTSGVVLEIGASSGDQVEAEAILCRLDDSEDRAFLEEALSRAQQIRAQLTQRDAEIEEEKRELVNTIDQARLRVRLSESVLQRQRKLVDQGLAAESSLEAADITAQLTRLAYQSLQAKDASVFGKELEVLRGELAAREQMVQRVRSRLNARTLRSPIAGQVMRHDFTRGELVRPDQVLFEVFGGEVSVLKLEVPERHALRVAAGQPYQARLASLRGRSREKFEGAVQSLRDVIESDGTDLYRVVYCEFDGKGLPILPGTSAQARIFYGRSNLWLYLFGVD
jgi:multidrug resistance efflux pump